MMQDLDKIPVGSDGLITLPYFAGERTPINDPLAGNSIWINACSHASAYVPKCFGICCILSKSAIKDHA